jgi:protoporphyrinogen oxidase
VTAGAVVIVGGGPCGLACARRLRQLGHDDWLLLEAQAQVGGLAASVVDGAGFTWDMGGHVVFSKFGEFDQLLADVVKAEELLEHERSSEIYFQGKWVPYPFQLHLRYLPSPIALECIVGLIEAAGDRRQANNASLRDWLLATFGDGLVKHFFDAYNTKVWATPTELMGHGWIAERVAEVDWRSALRHLLLRDDPPPWGPNRTFSFPAKGGTGKIWQTLADQLGDQVETRSEVVSIDAENKFVHLRSGRIVSYDVLVSTMPLDQLVAMIKNCPTEVRNAANALRHTAVHMVGIGYHVPLSDNRSWLYFPQSDIPFYRATNFAKYSPSNVPNNDTAHFSSWMTEVATSPGTSLDARKLAGQVDIALREVKLVPRDASVASVHIETMKYAYPVPTLDRDALLRVIHQWIEPRQILSRGRFGTWRYEIGNMDHAVKMGNDVADRIAKGTREELFSASMRETRDL